MPVYRFICAKCKRRFTVECSVTEYESKRVACPKCKSRAVRRQFDVVGVITSKKS